MTPPVRALLVGAVAGGGRGADDVLIAGARVRRDVDPVASGARDEPPPDVLPPAGVLRCRLGAAGRRLIDVQWATPHLTSLGVEQVPRASYVGGLESLLTVPDADFRSLCIG